MRSDADKQAFPEGKPKSKVESTDKNIIPADEHPEHLCYCKLTNTKIEREGTGLQNSWNTSEDQDRNPVNIYLFQYLIVYSYCFHTSTVLLLVQLAQIVFYYLHQNIYMVN